MKKALAVFALIALFAGLAAQDAATATPAPADTSAPAAVAPSIGTSQTARYTVISEIGQADAESIGKTLEAYFDLYNGYFHFDPAALSYRLQVRAFATKEAFDAYLTQIIGSPKDDFVYLHYPSMEKSELLVYAKADQADYDLSLAHQAFVQYLKAFAPGAPLWLREGFAVYFELSRLNPDTGKADFKENLSWLETVKGYWTEKSLIPMDTFLSMDSDQAREQLQVFYPQSWAFISFLIQSPDKDANRLLWDLISRLDAKKEASEVQAVANSIASAWPGIDKLSSLFNDYLDSKKTFPETVAYGIDLYNQKDYKGAEAAFKSAMAMDSTNHVPSYYLGLISYYNKEYAMAESYYKQSLSLGCEPGIANYALGVNAFVMGRSDDARTYLALAKTSSPDQYGTKVDDVLARIK
jgi:tetratricopeptide (TPR) repeat protein